MSGQAIESESSTQVVDPLPLAALEQAIVGQPEAVSRAITNNLENMRAASAMLAAARRVRLCGVGVSGCAAEFGAYLLRSIGIDARSGNAYDLAVYPTNFEPGELLLVISHSGNSAYVKRALRRALMSGLKTIGITGQAGEMRGPEVIIETVPQERDQPPTASFSATTALLATIAARIEPRSALTAALPALPERMRAMLGSRAVMHELAATVEASERRTVIVGAGAAVAIARAAALNMNLAAQLRVDSMHVEDALHGGLHGLCMGDVVIQIAPDGPAAERNLDLARVADRLGLERARIGGQPDDARWHISLPNAPEPLALLLAMIPLQWLALETATLAGPYADDHSGSALARKRAFSDVEL